MKGKQSLDVLNAVVTTVILWSATLFGAGALRFQVLQKPITPEGLTGMLCLTVLLGLVVHWCTRKSKNNLIPAGQVVSCLLLGTSILAAP